MEKINLPQMAKVLLGIDGMKIEQVDLVNSSDVDTYGVIAKIFVDKCIGLFRDRYDCVEKWSIPLSQGPLAVASFISFGVGAREKEQPKTIDAEINDFCCRHRKSGARYLALYFCSNGNDSRKIIIASVIGTRLREIPIVTTTTNHRDFL